MEVTKRYDLSIRRCIETESLEIEIKYEYIGSDECINFIWLHINELKWNNRMFCDHVTANNPVDEMFNFISPINDDAWVADAVTPELRDLIFKLIDEVKEEASKLIPAFKELI